MEPNHQAEPEKKHSDTSVNGSSKENGETPEIAYPNLLARTAIVTALMLATFLIALDMSIIGTAIPQITTEFNSMGDEGWYGSTFFLTLATFVAAWGKAYRFFSLRASYIMVVVISEIGSLVCALSQSSIALIVGRAVQGAGAAGLAGGGYTITAFVIPPGGQPAVIGMLGSVFIVASIAGPLLGGVFTSDVSWRWCFYINLPIGGVTVICLLVFFRTSAHAKKSHQTPMREVLTNFDPIGLVLMFSGVLCFFLAVQWGGVKYPWNSAREIGLLVGCVLLLALFAVNEWYQGDKALIVYRILRNRSMGACSGFIFFSNAANIALQYNLPIYFQAIQGDSPVESGIKMIPSILSTALATMVASIAVCKLNIFQPFLLAASSISTIGAGLICSFGINIGLGPVIGYQILYGVGTGLGVQMPNLVATVASDPADVSIAVSTVSFFLLLAGGWGVAVTTAVLNNLLLQKLPRYAAGFDPQTVLKVGAAGLKNTYHGEMLRGVQEAYLHGLRAGWALGAAAFGVTFLWSVVPKWPGRLLSSKDTPDAEKNGEADSQLP